MGHFFPCAYCPKPIPSDSVTTSVPYDRNNSEYLKPGKVRAEEVILSGMQLHTLPLNFGSIFRPVEPVLYVILSLGLREEEEPSFRALTILKARRKVGNHMLISYDFCLVTTYVSVFTCHWTGEGAQHWDSKVSGSTVLLCAGKGSRMPVVTCSNDMICYIH